MPKIDRHISDLLYDHDCVIVPDMGGFISSYSPATIHPLSQTIEPPSKKIAFNILLTHNDGLLASHIAKQEELSYNEAIKKISQYVDNYQDEIDTGKKFVIERVGILSVDSERRIQFEPFKNVNYLKDSFGLTTIHYTQTPLPNQQAGRIRASVKPSARKHKTLADALLLAGSIFWFCMNIYIVSPAKFDFASLNIFNREKAAHIEDFSKAEPKHAQPPAARVETVYVKPAEPLAKPIASPSAPISKNDELKPQSSVEGPLNFYVIAGAFRSDDNAVRLVNELKAQGFSNAGIIDSNNTLKKVKYGAFATLEEAQKELNRLKGIQKEGWIYRR